MNGAADTVLSWPAPAKLNLFLHITGRRGDGMHELQTLFQFIDYCDLLQFTARADGRIERRAGAAAVPAEADLTVRAARLLQQQTATDRGADIAIDKRLPMGGGLGGGSSDAATTLIALNWLWGSGCSLDQLADLGARLGADVPVFVRGHAAWGEGTGERLTPVTPPEPWYLVVVPACHVRTAEMFAAPELTRDCPPIKIRDFLSGATRNVFEPVVCQRYPAVVETMRWLARYAEPHLTGSGACVFAAFDSASQANAVREELPPGWVGFVARGCNVSPLYRMVREQVPGAEPL